MSTSEQLIALAHYAEQTNRVPWRYQRMLKYHRNKTWLRRMFYRITQPFGPLTLF